MDTDPVVDMSAVESRIVEVGLVAWLGFMVLMFMLLVSGVKCEGAEERKACEREVRRYQWDQRHRAQWVLECTAHRQSSDALATCQADGDSMWDMAEPTCMEDER